jgi:hypothetical protein
MNRLAQLATVLAVPFIAASLSILGVASRPYLEWTYGRPDFPAAQGFTDAERLVLATPSTLYLVRPIPRAELDALRHAGRGCPSAATPRPSPRAGGADGCPAGRVR